VEKGGASPGKRENEKIANRKKKKGSPPSRGSDPEWLSPRRAGSVKRFFSAKGTNRGAQKMGKQWGKTGERGVK